MLFGDFNRGEDGQQGTGADRIRYEMALPSDWPVDVTPEVEVNVWYQAMPPRWVADMFDIEADAIADFEALYWDYAAPDLVTSQVVNPVNLSTPVHATDEMVFYPNPVRRGQRLHATGWSATDASVECVWRDASGKVLKRFISQGISSGLDIPANWSAGIYFLQVGGQPVQRIVVE